MSTVNAVLEQYEKNKSAGGNVKKVSEEERLKRYFSPRLEKGTKSGEKTVRILPTKDGKSPFVEVFYHEIQVDGKWEKLFDPKQDGSRSPLNEVHDSLMATGVESDRELARQYRAKKFYVVKLIDRDNEADGVKFWRFKHAYKGDGPFDKLFPLFQKKGDITDPTLGRDVTLFLSSSVSNNGKEYTSISSIIPEDVSPLHKDEKVSNEWIDDPLEWTDVYAKKSEEFLEIVARGETPKWSSDAKKYVSSSESEENISAKREENQKVREEITSDPQMDDEPDDDLPF